MRIESVHIRCFRSLGDVAVHISDYTTLIGKNDSGKSSFLRAMQLLFDADSQIAASDRCTILPQDGDWFVEATISGASSHDDLQTDGVIRIRRVMSERSTWQYWGKTPRLLTFKLMQSGDLAKGVYESDKDVPKQARRLVEGKLPKGRVSSDIWKEQFARLVEAGMVEWESGWNTLDPKRLGEIVQPVFLEADARAQEEMADRGGAIFGRIGGLLLRAATKRHTGLSDALAKLVEQIEDISSKDEQGRWRLDDLNRLEDVLQEEVGQFDDAITVLHELVPPRVPSFDFSYSLSLRDRWAEGVNSMGHGLRRSVVFALLRTLRRLREFQPDAALSQASPLYLFLIEEPELYLHPQAERRRMRELRDLSRDPDVQMVLCTHSAFFVDLNSYKGILRFERPKRELTIIHRWTGPDLEPNDKKTLDTTYHFDPTRAAMLFADRVILVEGQTEKVCVPAIAERMGIRVDDTEVVDCTGNGSMQIYQRVLEELKVRYVAWLDSDCKEEALAMQEGCSSDLGRIVLTDHDWERMAGLPNGGKDKPFKSWYKFVHTGDEPNEATKARVLAAYNWENYGLEILSKKKGRRGEECDELPVAT